MQRKGEQGGTKTGEAEHGIKEASCMSDWIDRERDGVFRKREGPGAAGVFRTHRERAVKCFIGFGVCSSKEVVMVSGPAEVPLYQRTQPGEQRGGVEHPCAAGILTAGVCYRPPEQEEPFDEGFLLNLQEASQRFGS